MEEFLFMKGSLKEISLGDIRKLAQNKINKFEEDPAQLSFQIIFTTL